MIKYFLSFTLLLTFSLLGSAQTQVDINTDQSTIVWTGKKVTGSHTGSINIQSGNLEFLDGYLNGGSVIIDMASLTNSDLSGGMKGKLEGHLKSDDFFGVEAHPTATLQINNVSLSKGVYSVEGDLTIKGITAPISFEAKTNGKGATANVTVDRTLYNVKYGSGKFFENLGDKAISDNFELAINLVTK